MLITTFFTPQPSRELFNVPEPPQVTVKFLPVHKPTLEEKADPILYAKVRPFSCGLYLKQLTCFQAVQEKMASDLGISATDVQRAEFVKELRKQK